MADEKDNRFQSLWEELKATFNINVVYAKLTAAEKLTVLLATVGIVLVGLVLVTLIVFFLSLAIVWWIAEGIGMVWAYLIMCAFYILLFVLLMAFRKQLIINPIANFISRLFF